MPALALHEVDVVEVDAPAVAVDEQDDGQADTDLGGGHGDDEQGEDLPGDVPFMAPKATRLMLTALRISSIDMSTSDAVAAGEHAVDADAEQHGAEQEELVEAASAQSFLAITMAPTRAARSRTETTSKGTR